MLRYFIKRVLLMIPTFLAIILAVFILMSLLPGSNSGEFTSMGDGDWLDGVFSSLHMTETMGAKYIRYVYNLIVKQDFGAVRGMPNTKLNNTRTNIFYRLGFTLKLALLGLGFSMLVGIPAGTLAAIHRGKGADKSISVLTLLLNSIPSYALAVVLVVVLCLKLGLLPSFGFGAPKFYIMPTIVVSAAGIAWTTRMTRSAVMDVMDKQYVTVLRAKGISEGKIICGHVMKNAMGTVLASLNNLAAQLLCGTLIAENFFSFPGLGQLLTKSISERSQITVLGCVAVLSVLLMCVNIVSDMLSAALNPQIRMELSKGRRRRNGAKA